MSAETTKITMLIQIIEICWGIFSGKLIGLAKIDNLLVILCLMGLG